jgi:hypothetical protein
MMTTQQQQAELNPDASEFRGGGNENAGGIGVGGTVRLSPFWPHSPALWLAQAEGLFMVKGITDELAKYCHVGVTSLACLTIYFNTAIYSLKT